MIHRRAVGAALLAAAVAAACDITDPYTSTNELADNPGTIVDAAAPISDGSSLVWSRDGRFVSFELEGGTLARLDTETGQVANLDGPRDEHAELSASAAGSALYFVADRQAGLRSAYRLLQGEAAKPLTDRAPASRANVPGDGFLVLGGPGDRQVAYITEPDSLYVHDNETGADRFVGVGCIRAAAFSPQGDRLLCKRSGDGLFGIYDLTAGTVATVSLQPSERTSMLLRTRWTTDDSIHSLYRTQTRFRMLSTAGDAAYAVWIPQFINGVRATDFINWSWSEDGSRFAFWSHECLKLDRVGGCEWGQSVLYAVDLEENTGRPVAVVKGEHGAVQVAVSPDGGRVAFVFEGQLHLQVIS